MYKRIFFVLLICTAYMHALWNIGGIENNTDIILQHLCYGSGNIVSNLTLSNHIKFTPPYWVGQNSKGINKIQGILPNGKKLEISFDGYPTGFLKRRKGIPGVAGYKSTAGAEVCDYGKKCARVFIEVEGNLVAQFYKQFNPDTIPTYILYISFNRNLYSVALVEK